MGCRASTLRSEATGSVFAACSVSGSDPEIIQSRQWNLEDEKIIKRQLDYEFLDTLFSMIVGWAINSAMILLAAAAFFAHHTPVSELQQAHEMLHPLLGNYAPVLFAVALLFSGISSSITSGMAAGSLPIRTGIARVLASSRFTTVSVWPLRSVFW